MEATIEQLAAHVATAIELHTKESTCNVDDLPTHIARSLLISFAVYPTAGCGCSSCAEEQVEFDTDRVLVQKPEFDPATGE